MLASAMPPVHMPAAEGSVSSPMPWWRVIGTCCVGARCHSIAVTSCSLSSCLRSRTVQGLRRVPSFKRACQLSNALLHTHEA